MHDVKGKGVGKGRVGEVTFLPAREPASQRANTAERQKEETY